MQTGSLINFIEGTGDQPVPKVGMGVTILGWTDRYAATVVEVFTDKKIAVQYDHAKRTDSHGMSDAQTYEYSPNTEAQIEIYTRRKNGAWVRQYESMKDGSRVALGYRDHYHDFSF